MLLLFRHIVFAAADIFDYAFHDADTLLPFCCRYGAITLFHFSILLFFFFISIRRRFAADAVAAFDTLMPCHFRFFR